MPDGEVCHVLIVEDDAEIAELLMSGTEEVMQGSSVQVEICGDGQTALDRLQEQPFSLVLLDIAMPGLDGITLLTALRSGDGVNRRAPVVITSAYRPEVPDQAGRAFLEATPFLQKPFTFEELDGAIRPILRRP